MKTNKEKFLALVSEIDNQTEEKNNWLIANRAWLRVSQRIAFDILEQLDALGWTQKKLAEKMSVSPQYINKIVRGNENLTLETQVKLQQVLDIPILASYLKKEPKARKSLTYCYEEDTEIPIDNYSNAAVYQPQYTSGKVVKMESSFKNYSKAI